MIKHPKSGRKIIFYNPFTNTWQRGKIIQGAAHGYWGHTLLVKADSGTVYRMDIVWCFSITDGLAMLLLHAGGSCFSAISGSPDWVWGVVKPLFEKVR